MRLLACLVMLGALPTSGCWNDELCDVTVCVTPGAGGGGGQAGTTATTSTTASSTQGGGGQGGMGGNPPCGGMCQEPLLCDEQSNMCVACLADGDCDTVTASDCVNGSCVQCTDSTQCSHLLGTTVCDGGTCVECKLGEEGACGGGTTCDLLAKTCTGPAATSVSNCQACTNDAQCAAGHRCIPMDFDGSAHGYYCLNELSGSCTRPFTTLINDSSISGAAATNYCGIDEDFVSCEAVLALVGGWVCSGTDGMCSPDGIQPEVSTPGSLCRNVGGGGPNQCTYQCSGVTECLQSGPAASCGGIPAPTWCGG